MQFTTFSLSSFLLASLLVLSSPNQVNAHGFIKKWGVKGGNLENAQKTDLGSTSFRGAPGNTGWVGSKFLNTKASACSASNTPFNTVASPNGQFFSDPSQSASQHLPIQAGQSVQLVVAGNPGEGWPHRKGHVQAYMADCGGDCKGFDVTQGKFFKIHSEVNGIQNTLIPAFDGSVDGNRYNVQIPSSVPSGNYIFRYELIAFGQSSSAEGGQDQYYPFCGQLKVTSSAKTGALSNVQTVSFPGAYQSGNIDQSKAPGPPVINGGSTSGDASSGAVGDGGDDEGENGGEGSGSGSGVSTGSSNSGGSFNPSSSSGGNNGGNNNGSNSSNSGSKPRCKRRRRSAEKATTSTAAHAHRRHHLQAGASHRRMHRVKRDGTHAEKVLRQIVTEAAVVGLQSV